MYSWAHVGKRQAEYYKADLSRLILNSFKGEALGLFIIDEPFQQFGNHFREENRPFMHAGAGAAEPPVDGTYGGRTLLGGTYFTTDGFLLDYEGVLQSHIPVFSIYLKLRFYDLPTTGEEIVLKIIGEKIISLTIASTGTLELKSNGNTLLSYSAHQIVSNPTIPVWYHIVVTIGTVNIGPSNFESYCMLEVQTSANQYVSQGSSFMCKSKFNFREHFGIKP